MWNLEISGKHLVEAKLCCEMDMNLRIHYLKSHPINSTIIVASDYGGHIMKMIKIGQVGRLVLRIEQTFSDDWKWGPNYTSGVLKFMSVDDSSVVKMHKASYLSKQNNLTVTTFDDGSLEIKPIENESYKRCYHLHEQAVTDIKSLSHSRYITCAEDGKIKLWRYTDTGDMIQIGEFSGLGPAIMVLNVVGETVMAGDAAGNVFFFTIIN